MAQTDTTVKLPKGSGAEVGQSGTFIFSGHITAEEYNRNLTGKNALKTYDVMRRSDATVRSALQVVKLPILGAERRIEPASDDPQDQFIADFVTRELLNGSINFQQFLTELMTHFDSGFSVTEIVYCITDYEGQPYVGLRKLAPRKQRSVFKWETQDGQPGITQQLLTELVSIPREKLIIMTNDKEGDNDEGISLLRYAYKDWDMKDKLILVNAIALEKLAVGVPMLTVPLEASETEIKRAEADLAQMRANQSAFLRKPDGWQIEMLDLKGNSTKDVMPTIKYHDRQIVLSVLAQFLELGSTSNGGSRALSSDHSKLFLQSEQAAAANIAAVLNEQLIKRLVDLNFSDLPNGYPKFTFGRIAEDDVAETSTAIATLMTAGALHYDPELEQNVRQTLHLPAMPDDMKPEEDAKPDTTEQAKKTKDETLKTARDAAVTARNRLMAALYDPSEIG